MLNKTLLEKQLGIKIKDIGYFQLAFIHRSYLNESNGRFTESNERLEFLGDSILQFLSSLYLYQSFPSYPEGRLTNLRSRLVNTESLAKETMRMGLHKHLLVSKGEQSTVKESKHMQADTFEAVLGAIYLDSGIEVCNDYLHKNLFYKTDEIVQSGSLKDHKSLYQEYAQEHFNVTPIYKVLKEEGPDHNKKFEMGLYVNNELVSKGVGNSKRSAQQDAAKNALKQIAESGK